MVKTGVYETIPEVESLVGAAVRNSQGEELGRVYKVLMDESTGQIANVCFPTTLSLDCGVSGSQSRGMFSVLTRPITP